MRHFYTAVVERKEEFTGQLQTHPYEAAWASEAIFFVRVEDASGDSPKLDAGVQISADGLSWIDEGTRFATPIGGKGDYFLRVSHFGGWLRLNGEVGGEDARFTLTVHLALKE